MNNEKFLKEVSNQVKLRGFSSKTHKSYLYNLEQYIKYFGKDIKNSQKAHIEKYILHLINKNLSENTIRQILASLHFAFSTVLNKDIVSIEKIPRMKKKKQLPKVISKNEVKKLLENIKNQKHRLMIEVIYSSGLRVSELVNLKREDINSADKIITLRQAKGKTSQTQRVSEGLGQEISEKSLSYDEQVSSQIVSKKNSLKDRITCLSIRVKEKILKYLCENEFKTKYLFENNRNKKYSTRSIEAILKKASNILNKKVNPHMLRHSFANHLLESGTDIKYIQKLLGHSKLETTSIYTYVAKSSIENIKSPFDNI